MSNVPVSTEEKVKTIGGKVPEDLFWKFKQTAASRKEDQQSALCHALLLYIDLQPEVVEGVQENG